MVISDINIFCLGGKTNLKYESLIAKITHYRRDGKSSLCFYSDKYVDIQKLKGIWYRIEPIARLNGDYNQEFFDLAVVNNRYKMIFTSDDFKKFLLAFIKKKLNDSPVNIVYFFVDLQGCADVACSVYSDVFFESFEKSDLYFNVVYKIMRN